MYIKGKMEGKKVAKMQIKKIGKRTANLQLCQLVAKY